MKLKKTISNLLLAFVLVTIGFAIGKEVTLRSARRSQVRGSPATAPATAGDRTIVYYLHPTMHCVTCNAMERMTRKVIERNFADLVRQGQIEWRSEDFQENERLARKHNVASSTVVLVRIRGGQEISARRLDEVWNLAGKPAAFQSYVRQAISEFAQGGQP